MKEAKLVKKYEAPRIEFCELETVSILKDSGSIATPIIPFKGKYADESQSSVDVNVFKH